MVSLSDKWNALKSKETLSQKFMGTVRPDAPLKNRLDVAQKRLQQQIVKLGETEQKLKQKDSIFMDKIVEATKTNNQAYARMYATELAEIRKNNKTISNAKLQMEQVQIRLNTVSELGDVVVTLSPCMSLIKGLAPSISGFVPEINTSMSELSNMLGNMISDSSLPTESIMESNQDSADTRAILEEVHAVLEGETKTSIPAPPSSNPIFLKQKQREKEFII